MGGGHTYRQVISWKDFIPWEKVTSWEEVILYGRVISWEDFIPREKVISWEGSSFMGGHLLGRSYRLPGPILCPLNKPFCDRLSGCVEVVKAVVGGCSC